MGKDDKLPDKTTPDKGGSGAVDQFVKKLAAMPMVRVPGIRGRLMFALDATASRQPTWDIACELQAEMFSEAAALGGLDIQLAYYRGFGEFAATPWLGENQLQKR